MRDSDPRLYVAAVRPPFQTLDAQTAWLQIVKKFFPMATVGNGGLNTVIPWSFVRDGLTRIFSLSPAEAESLKDKFLVKVDRSPSDIKKHGDEWSNATEFAKWHKATFSFQKRKSTKRKSTKRKSGKRKSGKRKSIRR